MRWSFFIVSELLNKRIKYTFLYEFELLNVMNFFQLSIHLINTGNETQDKLNY